MPYLAIADERSSSRPWNRNATLAYLQVENLCRASLPDHQSAETSLRPRSNVSRPLLATFRISVVLYFLHHLFSASMLYFLCASCFSSIRAKPLMSHHPLRPDNCLALSVRSKIDDRTLLLTLPSSTDGSHQQRRSPTSNAPRVASCSQTANTGSRSKVWKKCRVSSEVM